jgi:tRNA G46 methylase TrmB
MGCGPGRFLLLLCRHHTRQQQPPMNYLGLEIRQQVSRSAGLVSSVKVIK